MEHPGRPNQLEKLKGNTTKRGYGKKNKRKNLVNKINLSLIGTNAAGLTSKKESFFNILNKYRPSIVTIQESKHKRAGSLKVPGYQAFEKVRKNKSGGGLLTCVDENLNPVLISNCKDDIEILTVEADLGSKKLRIINGYGPQEDDEIQDVLCFWQELEAEVIRAKGDGCYIIIEMDANAKVGEKIIKGDPHQTTSNGKIMIDIMERQNMIIANYL